MKTVDDITMKVTTAVFRLKRLEEQLDVISEVTEIYNKHGLSITAYNPFHLYSHIVQDIKDLHREVPELNAYSEHTKEEKHT